MEPGFVNLLVVAAIACCAPLALGSRRARLLQATSLPFIVTATMIAIDLVPVEAGTAATLRWRSRDEPGS